jgi:hypothetical protein
MQPTATGGDERMVVDDLSNKTEEIIRQGAALAAATVQIADELEEGLELLKLHLQGDGDD